MSILSNISFITLGTNLSTSGTINPLNISASNILANNYSVPLTSSLNMIFSPFINIHKIFSSNNQNPLYGYIIDITEYVPFKSVMVFEISIYSGDDFWDGYNPYGLFTGISSSWKANTATIKNSNQNALSLNINPQGKVYFLILESDITSVHTSIRIINYS
jgi:hypothetical protein